jgi:hypothetical protein
MIDRKLFFLGPARLRYLNVERFSLPRRIEPKRCSYNERDDRCAKTQRSDETVPLGREIGLKRIRAINDLHQTTGSIMLTAILNSIYRFLRSSLPASESTGSAFSTR